MIPIAVDKRTGVMWCFKKNIAVVSFNSLPSMLTLLLLIFFLKEAEWERESNVEENKG